MAFDYPLKVSTVSSDIARAGAMVIKKMYKHVRRLRNRSGKQRNRDLNVLAEPLLKFYKSKPSWVILSMSSIYQCVPHFCIFLQCFFLSPKYHPNLFCDLLRICCLTKSPTSLMSLVSLNPVMMLWRMMTTRGGEPGEWREWWGDCWNWHWFWFWCPIPHRSRCTRLPWAISSCGFRGKSIGIAKRNTFSGRWTSCPSTSWWFFWSLWTRCQPGFQHSTGEVASCGHKNWGTPCSISVRSRPYFFKKNGAKNSL